VRGRRVRFTGTVTPAHDGQEVLLQRRLEGEQAFRTVARAVLAPDPAGGRSAFATGLRATRTASYRVRIAADGDHLPGMSDNVAVVVPMRTR
jgi:hypothetical protein